jgi:predicted permease
MQASDPGFRVERTLTMNLDLPKARYRDAERQGRFFETARAEVMALPEVEAAAFINHLPVGGDTWGTRLTIDGAPAPLPGQEPRASFRVTTPGYFAAAGIPMRRGRDFTERDAAGGPPVAIVNEMFARTVLSGGTAVGQRVKQGGPGSTEPWTTIVGVTADARQGSVRDPVAPEIYFPFAQNPVAFYTSAALVARTRGEPAAARQAIEAVLQGLEPGAPISDVRTMEQVVARSMSSSTMNGALLSAFAALAVLLSTIGLYGLVSFGASQRTREFGVRLAMGATRATLAGQVLREALLLTAGGTAVGIAGAVLVSRLLAGLLYGVPPTDPLTYAGVIAIISATALTASAVPAIRASRLDPLRALREN